MCLTVSRKHHGTGQPKPKVAQHDIKVYKVLKLDDSSKFQHFQYSPNTIYKMPIRRIYPSGRFFAGESFAHEHIIYAGFHAFRKMIDTWPVNGKVVEFNIPKGTQYYIGDENDIVATQIRSGSLTAL